MVDTWGATQLPVPAPVGDQPVSDPALEYISSFVKDVINFDVGTAWRGVAHRELCRFSFAHDPQEHDFKASDTPCVFAWTSGDIQMDREADDFETTKRVVRVLWVYEPATQKKQAKRAPIINGITKALARAFENGRHKAWKVTGDADPYAATRGSVLWKYVNVTNHRVGSATHVPVDIEPYQGGKSQEYDGIYFEIEIWERLTRDITPETSDRSAIANTTDLTDPDNDDAEILGAIEDPAEA